MQQRNEKGSEPSMDDILASIRKIISEEPAPIRVNGAAAVVSSAVPAAAAQPPQIEVSLPTVAPPRVAAPPAPVAPSRLSDIMRELAPSAVPIGAPDAATYHDDLADLVEGAPEASLPASASAAEVLPAFAATATADPQPPPELPRFELPSPMAAPAPTGFKSSSATTNGHGDLGAFVPLNAESVRAAVPRPLPLTVGADMRTPEPVRQQRQARSLGLDADESREIGLDLSSPLSNMPQSNMLQSNMMVQAAPATHATKPSAALPTHELGFGSATSDRGAEQIAAAQSALGALAMGLAAPTNVARANELDFATDGSALNGRRSIDDAIVDMLRPMVRAWLDTHLPEMVEKTLRQELAPSGKQQH